MEVSCTHVSVFTHPLEELVIFHDGDDDDDDDDVATAIREGGTHTLLRVKITKRDEA